MSYRTETRISEDGVDGAVTVLSPTTAELLPLTAQECADQHLFAELQGRWVQERPMPWMVEVRVWQDRVTGEPAASAAWDREHGVLTGPSGHGR